MGNSSAGLVSVVEATTHTYTNITHTHARLHNSNDKRGWPTVDLGMLPQSRRMPWQPHWAPSPNNWITKGHMYNCIHWYRPYRDLHWLSLLRQPAEAIIFYLFESWSFNFRMVAMSPLSTFFDSGCHSSECDPANGACADQKGYTKSQYW